MVEPIDSELATSADGRSAPLLEARGICKSFLHVQALQDVDFRVYPGEIVALVGDNGAGKSTLMKILCGAYHADRGQIYIDGREVAIRNPHDAQALGIAVVYQDLALINQRDVASNVFLGREPKRGLGVVDKPRMVREARQVLQRLKINIPSVYAQVGLLSGGQRQAVRIHLAADRQLAAAGFDAAFQRQRIAAARSQSDPSGWPSDLHGRADRCPGRPGASKSAQADRGSQGRGHRRRRRQP